MKAMQSVTRLSYREDVILSNYVQILFAGGLGTPREVITHDLPKYKKNQQIIEELGGEDAAMFHSSAELHATISSLIGQQPKGISGTLLNNGYMNFVYLRNPQNLKWVELGTFVCDFEAWLGNYVSRVFLLF